jgi:hypothetical protein
VPAITTNPNILAAARSAILIKLKFKGQQIVLNRRGDPVAKPGGGKDFMARVPLPAQNLVLSQIGDDVIDEGEGGQQVIRRNYILSGAYDADIHIGDIWYDAESDYEVLTVNDDNGYQVTANVVGTVRVPSSTVGGFAPLNLGDY